MVLFKTKPKIIIQLSFILHDNNPSILSKSWVYFSSLRLSFAKLASLQNFKLRQDVDSFTVTELFSSVGYHLNNFTMKAYTAC